jgi:hypothetical protein
MGWKPHSGPCPLGPPPNGPAWAVNATVTDNARIHRVVNSCVRFIFVPLKYWVHFPKPYKTYGKYHPDKAPVTIQSPTMLERLQKIGITPLKAFMCPEDGELAHENVL